MSNPTDQRAARLTPLDKTPLQGRAYAHLKQALTAGLFVPGEVVTLKGVADSLGTSIMPVRDAVSRLVAQGALEMPTSRSIRVPLMSKEHFDDLCHCRLLNEGEAARLAAERIGLPALERLEAFDAEFQAHCRAGEIHAMLVANQAFHFRIYEESGSKLLFAVIETLWLQSGPYLSLLMDQKQAKRGLVDVATRHHGAILDALRRHDGNAARKEIQADITDAARQYRSRIHSSAGG